MYEFKKWQPWDYRTADTLPPAPLTSFVPSLAPHLLSTTGSTDLIKADAKARHIHVKEVSQLTFRAYGAGVANDLASFRVFGWMENGPGQILLDVTATLGSLANTAEDVITSAEALNPFGGVTGLLEVDTYAVAVNNCRAYVETAGANLTGFMVMNTMQYRYLELEIENVGSAGTEADGFGLIWRPLS